MKQSFVGLLVLVVLSACGGGGGGTGSFAGAGSMLPATGSAAVSSAQTATISTSGSVAGMIKGGFVLAAGSPHGDVNVYTSSSTTISGPAPYTGESVSVTGTGSWSTSIAATAVAQASAAPQATATPASVLTPSGVLSTSGTITSLTSTGFVLNQGNAHGMIDVTVTSATLQIGSASAGEYVQVTGSGSLSTAITATVASYALAAPGSITVNGTVAAATSYGFTLATTLDDKPLPIVVTTSAVFSGARLEVGSNAQVTGVGTATSSITAVQIFVTNPSPAPSSAPTATPAPIVPTPAPVSPVAAAPTFAGCKMFPQGDPVYNTSIAQLPADPDSSAYMTSFSAANGNGDLVAMGSLNAWPVNIATSSTPSYPLTTTSGNVIAGIENFPFLSTYAWENQGLTIADDRHIVVVNTSTCTLYEAYGDAAEPPAEWRVVNNELQQSGSYAYEWNLNAPYPTYVPNGVDAAHVPYFAGMVRWDDIQSGCVCHALNIDVMAHSLRSSAYVYPAMVPEASGYYGGPSADAALALPLGARLRLKSSFTLSCPSTVSDNCAQAQMIVTALKDYGAYVMDTGGYSGAIYLANEPVNGTQTYPWNSGDQRALDSIPMSAFQVVAPPGCSAVEPCVK